MSKPASEQPKSQRSILESIQDRTGVVPKVFLSDLDSEHGASPLVSPGTEAAKLVPQGRGNYQLLGEIARGGMGVILKGHDTDLGRDVAVKVLDGELSKRPEVVQRFVEEAQIGGQLQHPGIVPVYELGLMADERPYFTMKLVKGRTLAALFLQRKSPTDNRGRLLSIFEDVCQTVAYAHSKGVLHRDLKPANVMVGAFGEVQVVDWGLAKVLNRGGVADERRAKESMNTVIETVRSGPGSSGSNSMVGSVMGTPAYMAPEQAQGEIEKLDERADVFSLGAILCELLTGRPPYEDREDEPTVVQAARAKLDPARERIEACGADAALVGLCLDCLMPARAARPSNAEEVATAIHDYLSSTEERAQKAEIEAVEARIKAGEERRARRLTLALAGTIALVLAVGGGGYAWIGKDRAQRAERIRTAVEEAHGESIELGQEGKHEQALAAARRALALARSEDAAGALLERATKFVAKAEADLGSAQRVRESLEQDEALRSKLVDLRLAHTEALGNRAAQAELDAAFLQAFTDYGVDLASADLVPALERFREREIAEEVALTLDDWGRLRRKVFGPTSEEAANLFYLAMDLDPDPERMRMREAIAELDRDAMLDLLRPGNLERLRPGSIFVLSSAVWDAFPENRPDVFRAYDQAVYMYPGDFVLQTVGGNIYQDKGRFEGALACRLAALGQRPDDVKARVRVADSLLFLGRTTECLGACRACLALDPPFAASIHQTMCAALGQLGDYEGALESITRSLELEDHPNPRADRLVMRFLLNRSTRSELIEAMRRTTDPLVLGTLAWGLLGHPDPAKCEPQVVLEQFEASRSMLEGHDWLDLMRAVAYVRLERWEEAREAIGRQYTPPTLSVIAPASLTFIRSLIFAKLGHMDAAWECFERGRAEWDVLTAGNEAAWARSEMAGWRSLAAAALDA